MQAQIDSHRAGVIVVHGKIDKQIAIEDIRAITTVEKIDTIAAIQIIIAFIAANNIEAIQALDHISIRSTVQYVVAVGADKGTATATVIENKIGGCKISQQHAGQGNALIGTETDCGICPIVAGKCLHGAEIGDAERGQVNDVLGHVEIGNGIVTEFIAAAIGEGEKLEGIGTGTTGEAVITKITGDEVLAGTAVEIVIARPATEAVIAVTAIDRIVSTPGQQGIVLGITANLVIQITAKHAFDIIQTVAIAETVGRGSRRQIHHHALAGTAGAVLTVIKIGHEIKAIATVNRIVATAGIDKIITGQTIERVITGAASKHIVGSGAGNMIAVL